MTINQLKRLIKSASQDETRYHLMGINIKKVKDDGLGHLVAEATDGHRAVKEIVKNSSLASALLYGDSILITRENIETLSVIYNTKTMRGYELHFNRDGDNIIINGFGLRLSIKVNEHKYPNMDQFTRVNRKLPFRICFNPHLLASLCESMSDIGKRKSVGCTIEFDLHDACKAFTVLHGENETHAVLMPMRHGSENQVINTKTLESLKVTK